MKTKNSVNVLSDVPKKLNNVELEKFLGFNPMTDKKDSFPIMINKEKALYILSYHNGDNRLLKTSQVRNIEKSVKTEGYLWDGDSMRFNTNGDLTEYQHRLVVIVNLDIEVPVPVVTGVATDTFTKGAEARKRTAGDEIQRKYPKALSSEITCLGEFVKRRGLDTLKMSNAIKYWEEYFVYIREGNDLVDGFFDSVSEYSPYRRSFSSWAALMTMLDRKDIVVDFLEMLEAQILRDEKTTLTNEFYEFFAEQSWKMSNAGRATFMFQMLCVASDRLDVAGDGDVQLNVKLDQMNHHRLSQKGFYRKFLQDPQGLLKAA